MSDIEDMVYNKKYIEFLMESNEIQSRSIGLRKEPNEIQAKNIEIRMESIEIH